MFGRHPSTSSSTWVSVCASLFGFPPGADRARWPRPRGKFVGALPIGELFAFNSIGGKTTNDTTLILANDFSINKAFRIINIFERGSGSRLNSQKTEGLWLGPLTGPSHGPVNITWVTDKLKILGVYFGNGNLDHANWDN